MAIVKRIAFVALTMILQYTFFSRLSDELFGFVDSFREYIDNGKCTFSGI